MLLGLAVLAAAGGVLSWFLYHFNYIASGNDIWGHLYKSQYMYEQIQQGNWYPLYTGDWYNGIQPYRYWAPFPYYCMASLLALTGGNMAKAYCLFAGVSLAVGGAGFVFLSNRMKRLPLGTVLGIFWFFMPENFRVFFCEGNLPRMVTAIIIPYFIYFLYRFLEENRTVALFGILVTTALITLSHAMIGAMTGVATFLFFCFYCWENDCLRKGIRVLVTMVLAFAVIGIWLLPALSGGLVGMNSDSSAEVMASLMYSLSDSLNPSNRVSGIVDTFYYGISVVVLSVLGILLGKKKNRAGYYLAILILLLTTTAALPFLSKLPLNQLLWMMRFATIAYALFLLSFLQWKTLKKPFVVLFTAILILDCIPSMNVERYYTQSKDTTSEEVAVLQKETSQRTSILDLSAFGSYPSYGLNQGENATAYTYGWAWQGAETAPNIVHLNEALEKENYRYLFDRSVELGDDTVMVRKNLVGAAGKKLSDLLEGAEASGYSLIRTTENAYIFKKATPDCFGVVTEYKGLAIGSYADSLELYYPSFTTGDSQYLDDYTYEELSQYDALFLSGFSWHNREKAEQLVVRLGKAGVRVVVDGTHLAVDKKTNRQHFLGVTMQDITFSHRYPTLYLDGEEQMMLDFSEENQEWNTGYLEGCDESVGTFSYSDQDLTWLGSVKETPNVWFLGLNLAYHSIDREDRNGFAVLSRLFAIEQGALPQRQLVELTISYRNSGMTITSLKDNVNTTLAFLDSFATTEKVEKKNHLLYVNQGTTRITYHYPYLVEGAILSVVGILLFVVYFLWICKKSRELTKAEEEDEGKQGEEQ